MSFGNISLNLVHPVFFPPQPKQFLNFPTKQNIQEVPLSLSLPKKSTFNPQPFSQQNTIQINSYTNNISKNTNYGKKEYFEEDKMNNSSNNDDGYFEWDYYQEKAEECNSWNELYEWRREASEYFEGKGKNVSSIHSILGMFERDRIERLMTGEDCDVVMENKNLRKSRHWRNLKGVRATGKNCI